MKTTPKTGGDATKAGGAVLPVVGYSDIRALQMNAGEGYPYEYLTLNPTHKRAEPLTPHAPAQATIDELRAEVERLTRGKVAIDELWSVTLAQLAEAVRRLEALKAKQIDVGAVMRLADEWVVEAIHAALAENTGHTTLADPDAAREALRAFLLGDGGTAMASQEKPHD